MTPFVRQLIVCDDIHKDPSNPRHRVFDGLLDLVQLEPDQRFPASISFCVYVELSSVRQSGRLRIDVVHGETSEVVFRSIEGMIPSMTDPLRTITAIFRIRDCLFQEPALYWIELRYNDMIVAEKMIFMEQNHGTEN